MQSPIRIYAASYLGIKYSRINLLENLAQCCEVQLFCHGAENLFQYDKTIQTIDVNLRPNTLEFYFKWLSSRRKCKYTGNEPAVIFNLIVILGLALIGAMPQGKLMVVVTGFGGFNNRFGFYLLKKILHRYRPQDLSFIVQNARDEAKIKSVFKYNKITLIVSSGVRTGITYDGEKLKNGPTVLCYYGRINLRKGLTWLLLFYLFNFRKKDLLLGGNASWVGLFIIKITTLFTRKIKYVGYVDDINTFLKGVDTFIYPANYNDGFPRVLIECWASGTFVISRDTELNRSFLMGGSLGLLSGLKLKRQLEVRYSEVLRQALCRSEQLSIKYIERQYFDEIRNTFDA